MRERPRRSLSRAHRLPLKPLTPCGAYFPRSYGVHNKELTAALRYRMDNSTIEPQVNLSNQHWKVSLEHKLSAQDHVEAHLEKDNDPRLAYVRNQDGVEVRLEAPVRSDIAASARIRVQRTFDL